MERLRRGRKTQTVQQLTGNSTAFEEFISAAAEGYDLPREALVQVVGRGPQTRTMAHVAIAIFVAEQMSPEFRVSVIKTFLEGKLLEFREMGGTEFKNLNAAIDLYLPGRDGKDNKGVYIQIAMRLRARLLGPEAGSEAWATANVGQTHARYSAEAYLVRALGDGLVRDYEHLKELVAKI
jgi:hypothetical protein